MISSDSAGSVLPCQRHRFAIPEGVSYLNCAYMGPQLDVVTQAGVDGLGRKETPWKITAPDFFNESEHLRGLFSRVIGAAPESVALVPAASYGVAVAAANTNVSRGQNIVMVAEQFPSNVYQWVEEARKVGADVVTVSRNEDLDWTRTIIDTIDDRTAVVALPTCHWTDGSAIDLVKVGARCREVGATFVVDGTQSIGASPFDVAEIDPDFVVASGYKWLLGPYSLGYLYVAPRHHGGKPIEHNWIARKNSEDFAGLTEYQDEFQAGARRFDVGERSNFTLIPMAIAALEQILDWGVENIHSTLAALTASIEAVAREHGLRSIPADRRLGHLIGVYLPEGIPGDLIARLGNDGVFVSRRGRSLRISPNVYNDSGDVDRLFHSLLKYAGVEA